MKRLDILDLDFPGSGIYWTGTSATVDTYVYKNASGAVLKTITITWTDSTKVQILSVVRS